jgi:hypothetical protein
MMTARYYNLTFSEVQGGLIVYRVDFKGFDKDLLTEGTLVHNWSSDITLYVKGKNPTDYLFNPLSPWFIISKRAQMAVDHLNVVGIQFLPVHVFHTSGVEIPGYAIGNVLTIVEALDYEHTVWMTPDREHVTYPQLNVLEEALQKKKVASFDIFRLAELRTQIYVSEHFRESLERRRATIGFGFKPVWAYE